MRTFWICKVAGHRYVANYVADPTKWGWLCKRCGQRVLG